MSPIEMGPMTGVIMDNKFHCTDGVYRSIPSEVLDLRGSCDYERMSPLRRSTTIQFHDIGSTAATAAANQLK